MTGNSISDQLVFKELDEILCIIRLYIKIIDMIPVSRQILALVRFIGSFFKRKRLVSLRSPFNFLSDEKVLSFVVFLFFVLV